MSHVSNRMAMIRFQNNRLNIWNRGCGCNFGCGYNNSVFTPGYSPYMRPMGFGFNHSLFRAGFISDMVMGGVNCCMGWIGNILGWCGFGGGGVQAPVSQTQAQTQTQNQSDSDLKLLQTTLKDTADIDYEVSPNADGTFTVTARSIKGDKQNQFITGSKEQVLEALGFNNKKPAAPTSDKVAPGTTTTAGGEAPVSTTTTVTTTTSPTESAPGSESKPTPEKVKEEIINATKLGDTDPNKIVLPEGYNAENIDVAVDDDGTITVTIKADGSSNLPTITLKGNSIANILTATNDVAKALEKSTKAIADSDKLSNRESYTRQTRYLLGEDMDGENPEQYVIAPGYALNSETNKYEPVFTVIDITTGKKIQKDGEELIAKDLEQLNLMVRDYLDIEDE